MSISDLYSSGKHKGDLGHFASVVKIAKIDHVISEGEHKLLDRVARNINISDEEYAKILKDPTKYPMNPPVSYNERIERLYQLTKMILADNEVSKDEVSLMRKVAVGLHFSIDNAEKVCDEAIFLVMNDNDVEDFTKAIKKVNKE